MSYRLIWDLPTRIFHWVLAGGFIAAAFLALAAGDDSPLFPYHGIIGLVIAMAVVLRLIWGVIGTRHAKFGSFVFGPGEILEYMKGIFAPDGKRYVGHNPGSSVAIFGLLGLTLAIALTGIMLGRGIEQVKEIHELLAYLAVALTFLHIAGVALHTVVHRENIIASMVHGKKEAEADEQIASSQPLIALVFLVILGIWGYGLLNSFDAQTNTTRIPFTSVSLQLAESEESEHAERGIHHDDDDD